MQKAYLIQNTWDIFCKIVDNYGDIGICWRLARQLRLEHGLKIRLWIDDFETAKKIITELDISINQQICNDITIIKWDDHTDFNSAANVVIEAFTCELPPAYLVAMVQKQSTWINLEYLSAEPWIDEFHAKTLPHGNLHANAKLIRHFYFPGFTAKTGGLIRERHIVTQLQDALIFFPQVSGHATEREIGIKRVALDIAQLANLPSNNFSSVKLSPANLSTINGRDAFINEGVKISLFCYPNAPIKDLLTYLQANDHAVFLYVPQSSILPKIAEFFGKKTIRVGDKIIKNKLIVEILPFLSQADYDQLLRDCDLNFVRGEDSWIRAIWAGKPFIWQPYWQTEHTHIIKLNAFINLYYANYQQKQMVCESHRYWATGQGSQVGFNNFLSQNLINLKFIQTYTLMQAKILAQQDDLVTKLVDFCNKVSINSQ